MKNCRSWSTPRSACGSTPADFGTDFLAESFMEFSLRYPDVTFYLDLANPDHAQRVPRPATCPSRSANCPTRRRSRACWACCRPICASREYLEKHGSPSIPATSPRVHRVPRGRRWPRRWPLNNGDQHIEFTPGNRFSVNGVAMARRLAMLGAGIAVLVGGQRGTAFGPAVAGAARLAAGAFPVYAVTETRLLPAKTRIFIEFLMERLGSGPRTPLS